MKKESSKRIYSTIKKAMDEYDADFAAALRRSDEINEKERQKAAKAASDWEVLEKFGPVV